MRVHLIHKHTGEPMNIKLKSPKSHSPEFSLTRDQPDGENAPFMR